MMRLLTPLASTSRSARTVAMSFFFGCGLAVFAAAVAADVVHRTLLALAIFLTAGAVPFAGAFPFRPPAAMPAIPMWDARNGADRTSVELHASSS